MKDYRTDAERMLHDAILHAIAFMERPKGSRPEYQALMGELRDARVLLENKQFGCPTGRHSGECRCPERKVA